jgi:hypothetical protein
LERFTESLHLTNSADPIRSPIDGVIADASNGIGIKPVLIIDRRRVDLQ